MAIFCYFILWIAAGALICTGKATHVDTSTSCPPRNLKSQHTAFSGNTTSPEVGPAVLDHFPWFWSVLSKRHNVLAVAPAKAMHTSIRVTINQQECSASLDHRCAELKRLGAALTPQLKQQILSTATRVLFIRDPFERALSAYNNAASNPHISVGNLCNSAKDCTFSQWVDAIKALGTGVNDHFIPITQLSNFSTVHYDYVFRVNSATDRKCFWSMLGVEQDMHRNASPEEEIASKLAHFTSSASTVPTLRQLYREDINLWRMAQHTHSQQQYEEGGHRSEATILDYFMH